MRREAIRQTLCVAMLYINADNAWHKPTGINIFLLIISTVLTIDAYWNAHEGK